MIFDMELGMFIDYDEYIVRLLQQLGMKITFKPRRYNLTGVAIPYEKSETRKA